ncbi:hypothetical protein Tco_0315900 [Tanacetum coccineum]
MIEVSTILEVDSADLVSRGEVNGFINVSLSNSATSLLCGCSTFVELIRGEVVSLFGEILGEEASLLIEVEGDATAVSGGSRVAARMGVDTTLRGLKYSSNIG